MPIHFRMGKGVWKMECYKESEGKKVDFVIFKEET